MDRWWEAMDMGPVDRLALRMLAEEGIARPMRAFDACRRYSMLVLQGLAMELVEDDNLYRRFMITDPGKMLATEIEANRVSRATAKRDARADYWQGHKRPKLRRRPRPLGRRGDRGRAEAVLHEEGKVDA